MKVVSLTLALLFFGGVVFAADFNPPRGAYSGSDIKAAMAQAKEEQRAIVLMYYDYNKGDKGWKRRSMKVLKDLESTCVGVYVDSKDMKKLTRAARKELSAKKLGTTYPRAVLMDAELKNLLFPMPQNKWAYSFNDTMRDAKREALSYRRQLRKKAERREAKQAEATLIDAPVERTWTDTQGRTLNATLNYISDDSINVTRDSGFKATIMFDQLSEADHEYIETYAGSLFDKRGG